MGIVGLAIYCFYTYKEWKTFDSERQTMESEAKAAEMQRQLDERAWIVPTRYTIVDGKYRVEFKNTGKTPALNVDADVRSTTNMNEVTTIVWPPNPPGPYAGVLGPDLGNHADTERIRGNNFYGRIWYDDIFGNHHWTDFSVFCIPPETADRFASTMFGNSTDDSRAQKFH